jgi:hypothetical protein
MYNKTQLNLKSQAKGLFDFKKHEGANAYGALYVPLDGFEYYNGWRETVGGYFWWNTQMFTHENGVRYGIDGLVALEMSDKVFDASYVGKPVLMSLGDFLVKPSVLGFADINYEDLFAGSSGFADYNLTEVGRFVNAPDHWLYVMDLANSPDYDPQYQRFWLDGDAAVKTIRLGDIYDPQYHDRTVYVPYWARWQDGTRDGFAKVLYQDVYVNGRLDVSKAPFVDYAKKTPSTADGLYITSESMEYVDLVPNLKSMVLGDYYGQIKKDTLYTKHLNVNNVDITINGTHGDTKIAVNPKGLFYTKSKNISPYANAMPYIGVLYSFKENEENLLDVSDELFNRSGETSDRQYDLLYVRFGDYVIDVASVKLTSNWADNYLLSVHSNDLFKHTCDFNTSGYFKELKDVNTPLIYRINLSQNGIPDIKYSAASLSQMSVIDLSTAGIVNIIRVPTQYFDYSISPETTVYTLKDNKLISLNGDGSGNKVTYRDLFDENNVFKGGSVLPDMFSRNGLSLDYTTKIAKFTNEHLYTRVLDARTIQVGSELIVPAPLSEKSATNKKYVDKKVATEFSKVPVKYFKTISERNSLAEGDRFENMQVTVEEGSENILTVNDIEYVIPRTFILKPYITQAYVPRKDYSSQFWAFNGSVMVTAFTITDTYHVSYSNDDFLYENGYGTAGTVIQRNVQATTTAEYIFDSTVPMGVVVLRGSNIFTYYTNTNRHIVPPVGESVDIYDWVNGIYTKVMTRTTLSGGSSWPSWISGTYKTNVSEPEIPEIKTIMGTGDQSNVWIELPFIDKEGLSRRIDNTPTNQMVSLVGARNGANKIFTFTEKVKSGSMQVYVNGMLQSPMSGDDYSVDYANKTVTFAYSPEGSDNIIVYGSF